MTTLTNNQQPPVTLEFSWSLPVTRIVQPGQRFEYRIGVMTDEQARRFPAGTATTKFSSFSIACP